MSKTRQVAAGIGITIVVAAALVATLAFVGVVDLGWKATHDRKELDIDAENRRHTFEYQQSARDTIASKVTEWSDEDPDSPHGIALRNEICQLASNLDGTVPSTISDFTEAHCA